MKTIHWQGVRKDGGIALHVWLMMVFFSITTVFLIKKFNDLFDAYTLNNLDRLIAYSSLLTGMTFGAMAAIEAVGKPSDRVIGHWLWRTLFATIIALVVIYSLFLSRLPNINSFVPQSLPEVLFMVITFALGILLSATVSRVYLNYLPSETAPIMRIRSILIIASAFVVCGYFIVKIIIAAGYFWPALASQGLIDLSWAFLISTVLLYFSFLLSNKMYARLVMISRNIQSWRTFQDLRYVREGLLRLFPEVVLPVTEPSFWSFILNPEYHLYRAIITIMDGKTMLEDLLSEGALHEEPPLWEGDMLREVVRVEQALQPVSSSGDFWEIVGEYRKAGRNLAQVQQQVSVWERIKNGIY
ncbi:MAG: hypothetical protein JW730_06910 [Anaerolineales bacterium]|nr:hypothetical protein [Anaerolineales bacterium]